MNDIKRASNAHVWCKSISILEAQYDCPDEWNVKQVLLLSRLNEYYGGIADSILGSHESFVPNNSLRGMYSISSGSTNIIRWKGKWEKMLSCHNKSQMITPLSITWEGSLLEHLSKKKEAKTNSRLRPSQIVMDMQQGSCMPKEFPVEELCKEFVRRTMSQP